MLDLVILGCGGLGREVADIVDAINAVEPTWRLVGLADDNPSPEDIERLARTEHSVLRRPDYELLPEGTAYVIGVGSGATRRLIADRLESLGWSAAVLVHPSVTTGADVQLGAGTVLCAGVRVTTNVRLGRHVHVNGNSTVGHDTSLGDFVTVNPLVAISGAVQAGEEATFGTHSAILQGLTVGPRSFVGAGACVVRDVPAETIVKGVPAR